MTRNRTTKHTHLAKELRSTQTKAESLLWAAIRGRRLSNLKFRRQHPICTHIVDFACVEKWLVVELDGEYHDRVIEHDLARQRAIEELGWTVIRFTNDDVLNDVDAVAIAIARAADVEPTFRGRKPC